MKNPQKTRIITVTGTKGKTSVVRAIQYAIQNTQNEPVLSVDTHKIMLGDEKVSTFTKSWEVSGLLPTVCPGRFLLALADSKNPVAVLEASISSGGSAGLGYGAHEIGIFTNVYDDHIGSKPHLMSRRDLAKAKSFIFSSIKRNGFAVYNADNDLVVEQLSAIPKDKDISLIACSMNPEYRTSTADTYAVTVSDGAVIIRRGDEEMARISIDSLPWLFNGNHEPSLYNAMFILGALWAFYIDDAKHFRQAVSALEQYLPAEEGGRMVLRRSHKGARVILDFAHETVSLTHIAQFARTLITKGKLIGVVRLPDGRPDEHIASTMQRFAPYFDKLVIYEHQTVKSRQAGEVAGIMHNAAKSVGVSTEVIVDERRALLRANDMSSEGDVIVYIIGSTIDSYDLADKIFQFEKSKV